MKDIIIYNIYIAWVIALCSSCNSPLSQALDEAGNNRSELEAVLEHYKNDELKSVIHKDGNSCFTIG